MITLTSDVADLILQRTLGENSLGLNNSINRMTTGYKVNQAKDNAAGYSIITDLSKKISSMLQVQQKMMVYPCFRQLKAVWRRYRNY